MANGTIDGKAMAGSQFLQGVLGMFADGSIADAPADLVYDMIDGAAGDMDSASPGSRPYVASGLLDEYFAAVASSDGGALDASVDRARRTYNRFADDVARRTAAGPEEAALAFGDPDGEGSVALDRLLSRYYNS